MDLVGPTGKDHRWQAREQTGYALSDFSINWEQEQARCPQGQTSSSWTPAKARDQEVIKIKFAYTTCGPCCRLIHNFAKKGRYASEEENGEDMGLRQLW